VAIVNDQPITRGGLETAGRRDSRAHGHGVVASVEDLGQPGAAFDVVVMDVRPTRTACRSRRSRG